MSKVGSGNTSDNTVERWTLPEVDSLDEGSSYSRLLTADQIERIQKQAYEEGFREGHREGYQSGETQLKQDVGYLTSILDFLAGPLNDVDQDVLEQILELTSIVARQVIRRELRADPGQIIAVVRECLKELPIGARKIAIYLHPDDAALVRGAFSIDTNMEQNWQIIEDPVLTRGGCRIEAGNSKIDATVEQQLNRVIANLMGGERGEDSE